MKIKPEAVIGVAGAVAAIHFLPGVLGTATAPTATAREAIAFARAQIGKPYVWGGPTKPGTGYGFDCSGLVMEAYASAGVHLPRVAADQYKAGPQVTNPVRGDLVFFKGSDGTVRNPGHVAIYLGPHRILNAYAAGYPVQIMTFGLPSSPQGLQDPVGYTDPAAGG